MVLRKRNKKLLLTTYGLGLFRLELNSVKMLDDGFA